MGYKETVMSEEQLRQFAIGYIDFEEVEGEIDWAKSKHQAGTVTNEMREVAEAQAKITWPIAEKAGIKKVVDWIEQNLKQFQGIQYLDEDKWQAFLKEGEMNKPPVLSDEFWEGLRQTILDGRKDYHQEVKNTLATIRPIIEPLIQTDAISYTQGVLDGEVKAAREIFEEVEGNLFPARFRVYGSDCKGISEADYTAIKSRFLKEVEK